MMDNGKWVDPFIDKVQDAVLNNKQVTVTSRSGEELLITIGKNLLSFLIANRVRLKQVGYYSFKTFLELLADKKDFEALVLTYNEFDNSALLEKFKEDSIKLAEIAKYTQEMRDFWILFARQAVERVVFSALGVLLKGVPA